MNLSLGVSYKNIISNETLPETPPFVNIWHDSLETFLTPLRAISGFAQIVIHDYSQKLGESSNHYMQHIIRASAQMDHLIDDLLNYTRIEHRIVYVKPIALDYLFQQVLENLRECIKETNARVEVAPLCGGRSDAGQSNLYQFAG